MYQFLLRNYNKKVCDDGQDKFGPSWSESHSVLSPPTPQLSYVWRNGTMSTNGLVTKYRLPLIIIFEWKKNSQR